MNLDARAVEAHRFDLDAHDLLALQVLEHAVENAFLRPAVHARVYGVPTAKALGQSAPLAAVLGNVQDRVEHLEVRDAYVTALFGKQRCDPFKLGLGEFHVSEICFRLQRS